MLDINELNKKRLIEMSMLENYTNLAKQALSEIMTINQAIDELQNANKDCDELKDSEDSKQC